MAQAMTSLNNVTALFKGIFNPVPVKNETKKETVRNNRTGRLVESDELRTGESQDEYDGVYPFDIIHTSLNDMNDASLVYEQFHYGNICIINLNKIDVPQGRRCMDIISGAAFMLGYQAQELSTGIILFAPEEIDIMPSFHKKVTTDNYFRKYQ